MRVKGSFRVRWMMVCGRLWPVSDTWQSYVHLGVSSSEPPQGLYTVPGIKLLSSHCDLARPSSICWGTRWMFYSLMNALGVKNKLSWELREPVPGIQWQEAVKDFLKQVVSEPDLPSVGFKSGMKESCDRRDTLFEPSRGWLGHFTSNCLSLWKYHWIKE